jgi:hypothetical protein
MELLGESNDASSSSGLDLVSEESDEGKRVLSWGFGGGRYLVGVIRSFRFFRSIIAIAAEHCSKLLIVHLPIPVLVISIEDLLAVLTIIKR